MEETEKPAQLVNLRALLLRLPDNVIGITLAAIVGVGAGFGAVVFWKLIQFFSWLFFNQGHHWFSFLGDYYVIILPAIGGLIFGPVIYFVAREAKGDGIPETMKACAVTRGRIRARVSAVKVLVSSICLGSGGSAGREGPIVQIGGSIGSATGQLLHVPETWMRGLILCGVAGGISATFNAPIAGAFFALEIIQRRVLAPNAGYVIVSSVAGSIIARIFLFTKDRPTAFQVPAYSMGSNWEFLFYLLLGLICAIVGITFVKLFYRTDDLFARIKMPEYCKPAVGGILVGAAGFFYPQIFGVGYGPAYGVNGVFSNSGIADSMLMSEVAWGTLLAVLLLKMIATSITLGSGGSGGAFAPALVIGAALGGLCGILFAKIFPGTIAPIGVYAMVGMAAFFAVVVQGPITAIIIIFEMTGQYSVVLPVMTAVVVATLAASPFMKESIYTFGLQREGVNLRRMEEHDIMQTVTVFRMMTRNFPSVPPQMPVTVLLSQMEHMGQLGFPVVDNDGNLAGIVTLTDVHAAMEKEGSDIDTLTVADICTTKSLIVAYPDQTLREALLRLGAKDFGRIPVVDRNNPKKLLGVLRRHDVVRAYIDEVGKQGHPRPPEGSIVF